VLLLIFFSLKTLKEVISCSILLTWLAVIISIIPDNFISFKIAFTR